MHSNNIVGVNDSSGFHSGSPLLFSLSFVSI